MESYKLWLEKQIEKCLNDDDLQREHWAFCVAYEVFCKTKENDDKKWIPLSEKLPKENETVWLLNENSKFIILGCRVWTGENWFYAKSNGIIYFEDGKIVSECEIDDDYDFTHFSRLPDCQP